MKILAFAIVCLLPLLIVALSYKLLVSQPFSLATLIGGKVAVRAAVLPGLAVWVSLGALLLARLQAQACVWALLVSAHALFGFARVAADTR